MTRVDIGVLCFKGFDFGFSLEFRIFSPEADINKAIYQTEGIHFLDEEEGTSPIPAKEMHDSLILRIEITLLRNYSIESFND